MLDYAKPFENFKFEGKRKDNSLVITSVDDTVVPLVDDYGTLYHQYRLKIYIIPEFRVMAFLYVALTKTLVLSFINCRF